MKCNSCGLDLPPGVAACPRCGAPTPYNVTGGVGNNPPPIDKTIAATPYGASSTPSTAYGPPNYGTPQPANPYEAPNPYGVPQQPPYPYATPPQNSYSPPPPPQQYVPPVQQQYVPPAPQYVPPVQQQYVPPAPQYVPPTPPKKRRTGLIIGIVVLIILIILVGVFAALYQTGQHQLAVQGTATAQANVTATVHANLTATAIVSTYPFSNKVLLNDPLTDNSKGMKWDETTNQTGGVCKFTGNAYHALESQAGYFNTCFANQSHFSDFTFQVDMTITSGDRGGLLFRADSANTKLYYLRLSQTGAYSLFLYVDSTGTNAKNLDHGTLTGFNTGVNQKNTIGVVARGSSISIYVNKQLVNTITDTTYSTGEIGLTAESLTNSTEVVYNNAMVWGL